MDYTNIEFSLLSVHKNLDKAVLETVADLGKASLNLIMCQRTRGFHPQILVLRGLIATAKNLEASRNRLLMCGHLKKTANRTTYRVSDEGAAFLLRLRLEKSAREETN